MEREDRAAGDSVRGDDERDVGRNARRAVRETGRDVREKGADVLTSTCEVLGNLLVGLGEALSPRAKTRSRSLEYSDDAKASSATPCLDFSGGIGNLVTASARLCEDSPCAREDQYQGDTSREQSAASEGSVAPVR